MEGCARFVSDYNLNFTLQDSNNSLLIDAIHEVSQDAYSTTIVTAVVEELTKHLCENVVELVNALSLACSGKKDWSLTIQIEANGSGDERGALVLTVAYKGLPSRARIFTIYLKKKQVELEDKLKGLIRRLGPLAQSTEDRLLMKAAGLEFFHGGLGVVNTNASAAWISASPGVLYTEGNHYLEARYLRIGSNGAMIGVQESNTALTNYPGHTSLASGKGLYSDGHCYHDGTHESYGLTAYGPHEYVGVLLDMDNKTVSWSINGRMGPTRPLSGSAYCIVVSLYAPGDAVEILPEFCYHRS